MRLPTPLRKHYARLYGARLPSAGGAKQVADLGRHFGGLLYEVEVRYLVEKRAQQPEDVLWRRTSIACT